MSLFDLLRRRPVAAVAGRVTRTQAAALCAQALRRAGPFFVALHAPRGDAGRVAVPVVLVLRPPQRPVQVGWVGILLNGSIVLELDDSSVAAHVGSVIQAAIVRACQGVMVMPVPADPRTWVQGGYRVRQAATGAWTIATVSDGVARAEANTPEEALAMIAGAAAGSPAGSSGTAVVRPSMDPAYAARWIASALREHGHPAWTDGATILLGQPRGPDCKVEITRSGPAFSTGCPEPQRGLILGALRAVEIVEKLE